MVSLLLCASGSGAAPGDILFETYFNNNGDLTKDWDTSSKAGVTISSDAFSSPNSSVLVVAGESLTLQAKRAIDASVPAAKLSIWVRRGDGGNYPGSGADFEAQYLNDLGDWVSLEVFPGGDTAGEEIQRVYTLPSDALHVGLRLRFVNTSTSAANEDYWYLDDVIVTEALPLDHYGISFDGGASFADGGGITCEAASVTIVGHDANHAPMAPAIGTSIALSTSTSLGYWSVPSVGSLTDEGGGNATYTFAANDMVTLRFNHTVAGLVNIDINAVSSDPSEIAGEDPSIEFTETGFRFVDAADLPTIGSQIAAQESTTYYLQAIRTDDQTGACVNVFADGEQVGVELAAECNNPSTCAGLQLALTNNGVNNTLATNNDNGGAGAAGYTVTSMLFGADSKAAFTINYPDVGSVSLHARHQIENEDGTLSNDFMLGSSNSFVVRPADLVITTVTAAGNPNPGTTNAGSGFAGAGDPFRVVVEARNALGNITPNYGNETVPENVSVDVDSLVFPAGGANGTLSSTGPFSSTGFAGEFENTSLSWNEVGTFTAFASVADSDYLGTGDVVGTTSGNIGRFYPAEFDLISSTVANSCSAGAFSYMAEPDITVGYDIQAHNRAGVVVRNYDAGLGYPVAPVSVHGEANNDGTDLAARLSVAVGAWNAGEFIVADSVASFSRSAAPDGPFTSVAMGVRLNDLDSANFADLDFKPNDSNNCVADGDCDSKLLAGMLEARFGRLYVQDAHGPESAPIPMVWQTEYWNGNRFVLNADDQCSELPLAAVDFVGATSAINAGSDTIDVTLGGVTSIFDFSDPVGANDCLTATVIGFCDGRAGLAYGAPGSIVTYPIAIDLSGLPWLQGDWDQDGAYNDSSFPQVNIRFQHYRGHDRVIYWREVLQ